jgi:hypothetical protein
MYHWTISTTSALPRLDRVLAALEWIMSVELARVWSSNSTVAHAARNTWELLDIGVLVLRELLLA